MEVRRFVLIWMWSVVTRCYSIDEVYNVLDENANVTKDTEDFRAPYGCSFSSEGMCGFVNVFDGSNGPQWLRKKAETQQNNYYGMHGNQNRLAVQGNFPMEWPPFGNYYVYTGPALNNRLAEIFAELESPVIDVNETSCLYFSYHNRVPIGLTPTLVVKKRNVNTSDEDVVLAEYHSLNSPKWFEAQVPLPSGKYILVFAGKNYNSRAISGGQLAITNIAIMNGSCSRTVADWLKVPGDCGFERMDLCGYSYTNDSMVKLVKFLAESLTQQQRSVRQDPGQRQRGLYQSQTAENNIPGDSFLVMTSEFHKITKHGSRSKLKSPSIFIADEGCLYLWYYSSIPTNDDAHNVLNVLQLENVEEKLLFHLPIPRTNRNRWNQLDAALPRGRYHLILEAIYTTDFGTNDYVGLDNIEIFNRSCSDVISTADVCISEVPGGDFLCRNGGSCISTGKKSFRCQCTNEFYGDRCEHAYPCTENPCQNGGTCVIEGRMDFQCSCQRGYDGKLCEKVKICGYARDAFDYARPVIETGTSYLSTAQFTCVEGRVQMGEMTATCNHYGVWELQGRCLLMDCGDPPRFNGMTLVNVTNNTLNGLAKYKCNDGFTSYANQDFLSCRVQNYYYYNHWTNYPESTILPGAWLRNDGSNSLSCHQIPRCGKPPIVVNSNVSVTSELMNGVASYWCVDGYELNVDNSNVVELLCSDHGQWVNRDGTAINIQCWMLPDCGPPPTVDFADVDYGDTTVNATAVYTCRDGYRLIGAAAAVCWKVGENRLQKWIDWLLVPRCELKCPVQDGRRGNASLAMFQVFRCEFSGFETYSTNLKCDNPVSYVVKRQENSNGVEGNSSETGERIVFYGNELCIAEKVVEVWLYQSNVLHNVTRCESFCLQIPYDIHDIVVYDEITYLRKEDVLARSTPYRSDYTEIMKLKATPETARRQIIMRYATVAP